MIYVDAIRPVSTSRRWSHDEAAYLLADTLEELHALAERLGLKRDERFVAGHLPHYDITRREHEAARLLGAGGLTRPQTLALLHGSREGTIDAYLRKIGHPIDQKQLLPPLPAPRSKKNKSRNPVDKILARPPPRTDQ